MTGLGLVSKSSNSHIRPFQNIDIAGGEIAHERKGYLEQALLAGSKPAAEVIDILSEHSSTLANNFAYLRMSQVRVRAERKSRSAVDTSLFGKP